MNGPADMLLVAALACALYTLATSRVAATIRATAFGGGALGFLPLAFWHGDDRIQLAHIALMAAGTIAIKALLIPLLLFNAMRSARVAREVEPYVSLHTTLVLGLVLVGISFWLGSSLELPNPPPSSLTFPTGFSLVLLGFVVLVNRKKAISQVVGFLMLENGVYVFGQCLARDVPFTVELGILLDLLVAVFVMGITIQHIGRAFDDVDADALSTLRE